MKELLILIVGIIVYGLFFTQNLKDKLLDFINWLKDNPVLGGIAFIFIYMIATILWFPGIILTIGSGFAFT